jgi:hypothetical protein
VNDASLSLLSPRLLATGVVVVRIKFLVRFGFSADSDQSFSFVGDRKYKVDSQK